MNSETKTKNEKIMSSRVLPALFLGLFFIAFLVIGRLSFTESIFEKPVLYKVFRAISFLIFVTIIGFMFFELNRIFVKNKFILSVLIIVMLAISLLDVNFFKQTWLLSEKQITSIYSLVKLLFIYQNKGLNLFIILLIPLVFFVLKIFEIGNRIVWKELLSMTFYHFLTSFILIFFIKLFLLALTVDEGVQYIILFVFISIGADIGGFFGGKLFGHKLFANKLAPQISPKKTIEGSIVGYLFSLVLAFMFIYSYNLIFPSNDNIASKINGSSTINYVIIMWILVSPGFAIIGDLYFSLLKRKTGVKDFSKLLKGHGGILDRIDSISVVFCVWFIFMMILI